MSIPITVTLKEDHTAEPNTCGSCKFFRRNDEWAGYGRCQFILPLWVAVVEQDPDRERSVRELMDTGRCDLYQPSGLKYQKMRVWKVE